MSNPVTVVNELAKVIEVIPKEMAERFTDLIGQAEKVEEVTKENLGDTDQLLRNIHQLTKEVEARRKELKGPITQLGKAIDTCAKNASQPLADAKTNLQRSIQGYNRKVQEEQRRLQREAEEKARKEREEAMAKAKAEAEEQRKEQERLANEAAAMFGGDLEPVPEPVVVEPVVIEAPKPVVPAAPVSTAVRTRKVTKVVIDDPRAIAALYEINGAVLVNIDEKAIKKLLEAGARVIGARLVTEEVAVMGR